MRPDSTLWMVDGRKKWSAAAAGKAGTILLHPAPPSRRSVGAAGGGGWGRAPWHGQTAGTRTSGWSWGWLCGKEACQSRTSRKGGSHVGSVEQGDGPRHTCSSVCAALPVPMEGSGASCRGRLLSHRALAGHTHWKICSGQLSLSG
jgi:hypothetical protein